MRTMTSVVYMVAVAALCALKWCVPFTTTVFGTNIYWGALGFDAVFLRYFRAGQYRISACD